MKKHNQNYQRTFLLHSLFSQSIKVIDWDTWYYIISRINPPESSAFYEISVAVLKEK